MNQKSGVIFSQQGQALLLVVLVLIISMTIGLSVATRSITNVRTSSEEQDSQRAFSAAEAGIERAINSSNSGTIASPIQIDTNAQIKSLTVGQLSGNQILINNGTIVSRDDGVDIWLVNHKADGTPNYASTWNGDITIYWGSSADTCSSSLNNNTMAAIEVVTITGTDTAPASHHYYFDPCTTGSPTRVSTNSFTGAVSAANDWTDFRYKGTISSISSGLLLRIIPLYADTRLGVKGNALPVQGSIIESTGTSGDASRKIVTFKGYPKLPTEIFPHMLFWPQ
jgi:hypothetical protein